MNDQSVDFLDKTLRNRNALSLSEEIKNKKPIYQLAYIDADETTTIAFLFTLQRISAILANVTLYS